MEGTVKKIQLTTVVYDTPELIAKANRELGEKAQQGLLIPIRRTKYRLELAEPRINGIYTIYLNRKGFIKKIVLW